MVESVFSNGGRTCTETEQSSSWGASIELNPHWNQELSSSPRSFVAVPTSVAKACQAPFGSERCLGPKGRPNIALGWGRRPVPWVRAISKSTAPWKGATKHTTPIARVFCVHAGRRRHHESNHGLFGPRCCPFRAAWCLSLPDPGHRPSASGLGYARSARWAEVRSAAKLVGNAQGW